MNQEALERLAQEFEAQQMQLNTVEVEEPKEVEQEAVGEEVDALPVVKMDDGD